MTLVCTSSKDLRWLNNLTDHDWERLKETLSSRCYAFEGFECRYYTGGTRHGDYPRIAIPRDIKDRIEAQGGTCREKVQASHVALYSTGHRIPPRDPEPNPTRTGLTQSFWVASHLCHNQPLYPNRTNVPCTHACIRRSHLIWEENWKNRARDGCSGKLICPHCSRDVTTTCTCRSDPPCINGHRPQ
jgi:hypothetical protein